jgi:hypothetical protein
MNNFLQMLPPLAVLVATLRIVRGRYVPSDGLAGLRLGAVPGLISVDRVIKQKKGRLGAPLENHRVYLLFADC